MDRPCNCGQSYCAECILWAGAASAGIMPQQDPAGYGPQQDLAGYVPQQYPAGYGAQQYPAGYVPPQDLAGYVPPQYPAGYGAQHSNWLMPMDWQCRCGGGGCAECIPWAGAASAGIMPQQYPACYGPQQFSTQSGPSSEAQRTSPHTNQYTEGSSQAGSQPRLQFDAKGVAIKYWPYGATEWQKIPYQSHAVSLQVVNMSGTCDIADKLTIRSIGQSLIATRQGGNKGNILVARFDPATGKWMGVEQDKDGKFQFYGEGYMKRKACCAPTHILENGKWNDTRLNSLDSQFRYDAERDVLYYLNSLNSQVYKLDPRNGTWTQVYCSKGHGCSNTRYCEYHRAIQLKILDS